MSISLMANNAGFEILDHDKQLGKIIWKLEGQVMVMNGTLVDPSLRGQDMGKKLLNAAADYAREHNYKMKAVCPYVVKQFDQTTDYDDLKM